MSELTRISISLEESLLAAFDQLNEGKGYATRSEAIRDLIRDRLLKEDVKKQTGEKVGVVSLVYDHHARELAVKLIEKQHHHHDVVVSTLHVHLGAHHCLEVTVLRGPIHEISHLAEELLATKGVLHGEVMYTGGEQQFQQWK